VTARPKDIGTAAETAVVRYLRAHGFPHAERRALTGAYDQGDVTGIPGVVIEVKGGKAAKTASDGQVAAWLAETETERVNARADVGVLVMARAGIGPANAGRWWAVLDNHALTLLTHPSVSAYPDAPVGPVRMHLADVALLLRWADYGTPIGDEIDQEEAS
jgi:hypothetical protein